MSDETNGRVPAMAAGWYDDPTSIGDARYWDGFGWTTSVSSNGVTTTAAIEPALVGVPPVRGSEFHAHRVPAPAPAPAPVTVNPSPSRSPVGGILAAILGLAAIVALVIVLTRDDGGDTPPPSTDTPVTTPATDAPAADGEPTDSGGG